MNLCARCDVAQLPRAPRRWAFSIWGVIWLLQGAATLHQALQSGYEKPWKKALVNAVGYTWQCGWYAQSLWQFLFLQQSQAGMLSALVAILLALASFLGESGRSPAAAGRACLLPAPLPSAPLADV